MKFISIVITIIIFMVALPQLNTVIATKLAMHDAEIKCIKRYIDHGTKRKDIDARDGKCYVSYQVSTK